jgi:putative transposase
VEVLVIYVDGQRFADHHIISAVGVDAEGKKHILGIEPGATENAASVKRLLAHLRDHGLPTDRQYLFVIDGAKALRAGIEEVFGADQPAQRCRNHKVRSVLDELPKEQHGQALNLMRAAWKVKTAEEGEKRLEQLARFLERDYEPAARSLREGMKEMFTLQRLHIPDSLHECLATTNIIESPQGGVERRTHNVTRWRDADMVQALGVFRLAAYRKALSPHRRPRPSLVLGGDPPSGRISLRMKGYQKSPFLLGQQQNPSLTRVYYLCLYIIANKRPINHC